MFQKRERFDRTDVPQEGRFTWLWGIIGIVVAFALAYLAVRIATTRVDLEERLEDDALVSAVSSQSDATEAGGYSLTSNDVTCVLLLQVSTLDDEEACTLVAATVLVVDDTAVSAATATVPTEVKVSYADETWTLSGLCAAYGYAACVEPLASAAGVRFDCVIVSTEDVLEALAGIAGAGEAFDFVTYSWTLLEVLRTSADDEELTVLADSLAAVGTANVSSVEVTLSAETSTDADGNVTETGYQTLEATSLRVSLGLLVSTESTDEAEGDASETTDEATEDASEESTE